MVSTKALFIAATVALAQSADAFNSHRHLHRAADRRAVETKLVVVTKLVYDTDGANSNAKPTESQAGVKDFVQDVAPVQEPGSSVVVEAEQSPTVVSTSSPSNVVGEAEDGTLELAAPVEQPAKPKPAKPTTTLITSTKKAAPPSTQAVSKVVPQSSAASQSTSVAPKPKPSSSSSSSSAISGGKRGLAYNDANLANTFGSSCSNCGWGYNWGQTSDGLSSKYSYIPLLWSPQASNVESWSSHASSAISSGSKALFSFNECDNAGQCNMDPVSAAAAHAKYMNPFSSKAQIGAPSVTNSQSPGQGVDWLKQFLQACDKQDGGCAVDFCNVHWYSPASAADTLFEHLDAAHTACGGKPIYLTEFAPSGSAQEISDFMNTVLPKLEALDYLHGYAYFMVAADSLMEGAGVLSSVGKLFASIL